MGCSSQEAAENAARPPGRNNLRLFLKIDNPKPDDCLGRAIKNREIEQWTKSKPAKKTGDKHRLFFTATHRPSAKGRCVAAK
jgi:hypothetical protein